MKNVTVSAKIPKELLEKVKKAVEKGGYIGISDYIRDILREKLCSDSYGE